MWKGSAYYYYTVLQKKALFIFVSDGLFQCQRESSGWGVVKQEIMQCKTAQFAYSMAVRQPWGQSPLWLDSSALLLASLLHTKLAALLHCASVCSGKTSSDFSSAREMVFTLQWKRKVFSQNHKFYIDRSPRLWSLIGLSSCQWGIQVLRVWLDKRPCPIDQNRAVLVGHSCTAPTGWGKP